PQNSGSRKQDLKNRASNKQGFRHGNPRSVRELDVVACKAAHVDHAGVENKILTLDAEERALDHGVLVETERGDLLGIGSDRIFDAHGIDAGQHADGVEAKALAQVVDVLAADLDQARLLGEQVGLVVGALEHVAPVGLVGRVLLEQHFQTAGLEAAAHAHDGQGLHRTLVDPAGGDLGGAGDADLHAGGVGQIDD